MTLKDICKRYTIVGEDGVNYCDTDNCPFAKRDLSIDFMPIDRYSCIADYPYLKEKHEADLLKEFVEYCKKDVEDGDEEAKATIDCWLNLLLEKFLKENK